MRLEVWKIIIIDFGDRNEIAKFPRTRIRKYSAIKNKGYKLPAISRVLKENQLMVPDSNQTPEYVQGHIFCLPEKFDEAVTILRDWIINRTNESILKKEKEIKHMQSVLNNLPNFGDDTDVRELDDV